MTPPSLFPDQPSALTEARLAAAVDELASRDPSLAAIVHTWGPPPFWTHPTGFAGLILAILAQQVSLESAQAAFAKLERALGRIEPAPFLDLDDAALRAVGFSRQKASYGRGLAQAIAAGELDLEHLARLEDEPARQRLVALRGVGRWTADTYLLFALRRADAWPTGDLALAKALQEAREMPRMPSFAELDELAEVWRPWRAVAARILWHGYLSRRNR